MRKISNYVALYCLAACFLMLLSYLRYSFSIGSYYCTFSGISILPVLGYFFTLSHIGIAALIYSLGSVIINGSLFIPFSKTAALPTLIASLCFTTQKRSKYSQALFDIFLYIALPLFSFCLFIFHPEGRAAWYYGLYWVIPPTIYSLEKLFSYNSVFTTALASTFLAHAMGSLIYLYCFSVTAAQWTALMPIVFAERLIIATSMTLTIHAYTIVCALSFPALNKKQAL